MKYIHGTEDFTLDKDSAVTLGKFDGVHMGHQKLISIVEEKAKQNNILAAAFTFDRIPLSICPQRQQHFKRQTVNVVHLWRVLELMPLLSIRLLKNL